MKFRKFDCQVCRTLAKFGMIRQRNLASRRKSEKKGGNVSNFGDVPRIFFTGTCSTYFEPSVRVLDVVESQRSPHATLPVELRLFSVQEPREHAAHHDHLWLVTWQIWPISTIWHISPISPNVANVFSTVQQNVARFRLYR